MNRAIVQIFSDLADCDSYLPGSSLDSVIEIACHLHGVDFYTACRVLYNCFENAEALAQLRETLDEGDTERLSRLDIFESEIRAKSLKFSDSGS